MSIPRIRTAVPLRRYQYGEFLVTVLGDIESDEPVHYRYLLAVAQEGSPTPGLFIAAQRTGDGGPYDLRIAMQDGSQVVDSDERWGDLEAFVKEGLGIIATMLNLGDEMPHRLM